MKIKISYKWAQHHIACRPERIPSTCLAGCCNSSIFWPSRTGTDGKTCYHLGPNGCTLGEEDKPILCLTYPFILSKANTLVKHFHCNHCKLNVDIDEEFLIETMRGNLETLFGETIANLAIESVKNNKDFEFETSEKFDMELEREAKWTTSNTIPLPRRIR